MLLIDAMQSIFSILIMVTLGFMLTHLNWFDQKTADLFSRLLVNISLPALMIYNLTTSFTRPDLIYMWSSLAIPFIAIILSYILGTAVSVVIGVKKGHRGVFRALFTFSNTIFMGLPVNIAIFGEKSVSLVTLYYLAHTTLFWTLGVYIIRREQQQNPDRIISIETVKRVFSPVLIAYLIANLFILLDVSLPQFVLDSCNYLSNLTTPLSMMFLGITLYGTSLESLNFNLEMVFIILGCFVITPLAVYSVLSFFSTSELMQKVFILEAAMPNVAVLPIVVGAYGGDHEYAALMVTLTTIMSLFVIPLYLFLFTFM